MNDNGSKRDDSNSQKNINEMDVGVRVQCRVQRLTCLGFFWEQGLGDVWGLRLKA